MGRPLVYLADTAAEQASTLIPGIPENVISDAIADGRVRSLRGRAGRIFGKGFLAEYERRPGHIRPWPRAYVITGIREASYEHA